MGEGLTYAHQRKSLQQWTMPGTDEWPSAWHNSMHEDACLVVSRQRASLDELQIMRPKRHMSVKGEML